MNPSEQIPSKTELTEEASLPNSTPTVTPSAPASEPTQLYGNEVANTQPDTTLAPASVQAPSPVTTKDALRKLFKPLLVVVACIILVAAGILGSKIYSAHQNKEQVQKLANSALHAIAADNVPLFKTLIPASYDNDPGVIYKGQIAYQVQNGPVQYALSLGTEDSYERAVVLYKSFDTGNNSEWYTALFFQKNNGKWQLVGNSLSNQNCVPPTRLNAYDNSYFSNTPDFSIKCFNL